MNHDVRLEPRLERMLVDTASSRAPDRLRHDIAFVTSRARQRPQWLASLKEPSMRYRSSLVVGSPTLRLTVTMVVSAVLLLVLAGTVVAGAALLRTPGPSEARLLHNGLIAFDSASGDILVADPHGSDVRIFLDHPAELRGPSWSPDGKRLAFFEMVSTGPNRLDDSALIKVVDSDGTGELDLTRGQPIVPALYSPDDAAGGALVWSPDSSEIAVTILEPWREDIAVVYPRILMVEADGSGSGTFDLRHTPECHKSCPPQAGMDAAWSPDGGWLASKQQTPGAHDTGLVVSRRDGTEASWVTAKDDRLSTALDASGTYAFAAPQWSPDGTHLVFTCCTDGQHDIWVIDADGTIALQVSRDPSDEYWPSWSPDGTQIAFQRTRTAGQSPSEGAYLELATVGRNGHPAARPSGDHGSQRVTHLGAGRACHPDHLRGSPGRRELEADHRESRPRVRADR